MITGQAVLETAKGTFRIAAHGSAEFSQHCISISQGDLSTPGVIVRLHSSCLFGEALSAFDCDCGQQLHAALGEIDRRGVGVVIYLYQEGRGAGIDVKLQAMGRQHAEHLNSYEAYEALGIPRDVRSYSLARVALADLGVARKITLLSNNPTKRQALEQFGHEVVEHLVVPYTVNVRAYEYLQMKKIHGKHELDFSKISLDP